MDSDALHKQVVENYSAHINPYLARLMSFAGFGVETRGEGCYLYDQDGTRYLDCLGGYGVFSLGHRHPRVVEAVRSQLETLPLSGKTFFNEQQGELAAKLAEISPAGLDLCFFSNSGTEAVEAALKFSKATTGRSQVVSTFGGYHGKTIGALATTGRESYRTVFEPLMPDVVFIPFGDPAAASVAIGSDTACMIIESVQGEGGIYIPEAGYLNELKALCEKAGALLVVDEVQTALGRTGEMFGCDRDGVEPDIITMAKALGGGVMPIGATLFTADICEAVFKDNPLRHTSTFGGNPLACAAAIATIQVVEEEGLCENSTLMGNRLREGLTAAADGNDLIAEVRGIGLMIGVEFAMDEVGELAIAQFVKRGLIAAYTLNNKRVIRFEPPLIITEDQVDDAIRIFGEALQETTELVAAVS